MRIVIQRAEEAAVRVEGNIIGEIKRGLMILVGVETGDTESDADWLAQKTANLRIFDDSDGIMNKSVRDVDGEILAISQFTLTASTRKGNRPSYIRAARGEEAQRLYDYYCSKLSVISGRSVKKGIFGTHMYVSLVNDGPETILIDFRINE